MHQLQDSGCGQATPMTHGVNGKQMVLVAGQPSLV